MLRKWRLGAGLFSVFGLVFAMLGGAILLAPSTLAIGQPQTICHGTNSDSNPYVVNPPDVASIIKDEGHGSHIGPIWAPGLKDAKIVWGDIIPAFDYPTGTPGDKHDGHYPGMNWTAFGEAIFNNNCELPTNVATSVSTVVFNASTDAAWAGTEQEGASAYDTSTLVWPSTFPTPTGTVTYTFYTNNTCSGAGTSAGDKTLTGTGSVPNSNTESDLTAGFYSFKATYNGDSMFKKSESACEPFTVKSPPGGPKITSTMTTVFNASTNAAWAAPVLAPASAYDTAKVVTPSVLPAPTGTVTYIFYTNGDCSGDATSAGTKTIGTMGSVPNSDIQSNLAAGSYAFRASYSGDAKYLESTSLCEPFTVLAPGTSAITTTVFDNASGKAVTGLEKDGVTVYDTSKVTLASGTPKGTVSYTFFANQTCSGTGTAAGTVTLDASGNAPISTKQGPLSAGWYSFKASFASSDTAVTGSTSACEPFDVDPKGAVLAATGMTTPAQSLALALMAFGLVAMTAALVSWRRREA